MRVASGRAVRQPLAGRERLWGSADSPVRQDNLLTCIRRGLGGNGLTARLSLSSVLILLMLCLAGFKYEDQIVGNSANERLHGNKNVPITIENLMMEALSTPIEYRAWLIVNRGWLLGAGWAGHGMALYGGNYANALSPDDRKRQFDNYCGYHGLKWEDYDRKLPPDGMVKWLRERRLEAVLTTEPGE